MAASLASDRSSLGCGLSQAVVATMRPSRSSSSERSWSSCNKVNNPNRQAMSAEPCQLSGLFADRQCQLSRAELLWQLCAAGIAPPAMLLSINTSPQPNGCLSPNPVAVSRPSVRPQPLHTSARCCRSAAASDKCSFLAADSKPGGDGSRAMSLADRCSCAGSASDWAAAGGSACRAGWAGRQRALGGQLLQMTLWPQHRPAHTWERHLLSRSSGNMQV